MYEFQKAGLFSTSCQLQSAAIGIQKIIDNESLNPEEVQRLRWAGNLFKRLYDHNDDNYCSFETTELRLLFESRIQSQNPLYSSALSQRAYHFLTSPKQGTLTPQELSYTQKLLQGMADATLDALRDANDADILHDD